MYRIGVLDSGVGGITVLTELVRKFGNAEYIYLGDTAHVPYGSKSPEQITKLSLECAQKLKTKGIDLLVIACSTISCWSLTEIQTLLDPIPVFGVVSPGIEAVFEAYLMAKQEVPILILGTRATIRSQIYSSELSKTFRAYSLTPTIFEQACPLLASMIEEGWIDHPILHQTISEYVRPYTHLDPGIALLGCTHYPWVHAAFEKALPGWKIINSAQTVVQAIEKVIPIKASPPKEVPAIEWIFTDPEIFPDFINMGKANLTVTTHKKGLV